MNKSKQIILVWICCSFKYFDLDIFWLMINVKFQPANLICIQYSKSRKLHHHHHVTDIRSMPFIPDCLLRCMFDFCTVLTFKIIISAWTMFRNQFSFASAICLEAWADLGFQRRRAAWGNYWRQPVSSMLVDSVCFKMEIIQNI